MTERYVVVSWKQGGSVHAETFTTLKAAREAYKRYVQPKNPHSLIHYAIIAKVVGEYRHNPYTAMENARKGK